MLFRSGLTAERLRKQLAVVAELNEELAPFRILTGIEVDILTDGGLDQEEDLLAQLDVVVASVHSELRMPGPEMTERMVRAIANPHMDILGHCTGRQIGKLGRSGKPRPESEFDPELVFAACAQFGVAVEINCRPDRLDPPKRLLRLAVEANCRLTIDTDAHAPGQLDWLPYGCARAAACGVPTESILNTNPANLPPVAGIAAVLAIAGILTKYATGWTAARRAGIGPIGRARAGAALIPRGEFNIVIAGLAVAASVHPDLGPLAAAYVLILAITGPLAARLAEPLARLTHPRPDGT